jgi:hypothetical protein
LLLLPPLLELLLLPSEEEVWTRVRLPLRPEVISALPLLPPPPPPPLLFRRESNPIEELLPLRPGTVRPLLLPRLPPTTTPIAGSTSSGHSSAKRTFFFTTGSITALAVDVMLPPSTLPDAVATPLSTLDPRRDIAEGRAGIAWMRTLGDELLRLMEPNRMLVLLLLLLFSVLVGERLAITAISSLIGDDVFTPGEDDEDAKGMSTATHRDDIG